MRYLKSAAFLMLTVSSSIHLLSQAAIASPSKVASKTRPSLEKRNDSRSESPHSETASHHPPTSEALTAIQDGAEGESRTSRLRTMLAGISVNARSPHFLMRNAAAEPDVDMEPTPDSLAQNVAQQTPSAPTSAPNTDALSQGSPGVEPVAPPASTDAEINELPDILFADPNPLSFPTSPEELEIEQNPVITLEQAIELAYRNNQGLQAALLSLEQAEEAVREAKAARLPTLSVGTDLTNTQQDGDSTTDLDADVTVNYNLFTGGSRAASIRIAKLQQEVSALAVEAQQEQIRLTTANLYYALQEAGEQIRINQALVEQTERSLRDDRLRQEVGVGTRFEVLRAEVQFANARQDLIQSQSNQQVARRDIARLLNLPPTAGIETTPVTVATDWPLTLEDSVVLASQNRAELEQQLLQADISEQQRQIALAALRPRVGLFARYNLTDRLEGNSTFTDDFRDAYTFGAQFDWTLFDGGAARAAGRQRALDGDIAAEQFSENLDQIRFDVEQAFFNLESNKENITTSQIAVAQAEEALSLANLRLQAGVGTQLDVLTAQTDLSQAEFNNVTAILGYNRALAAMERAVSNLGLFPQ